MSETPKRCQPADTSRDPCQPPGDLHNRDGWHWLKHRGSGGLVVSHWIYPRPAWAGNGWWDSSALGPLGVAPDQMAAWGWQWHAAVPSPTEIGALTTAARALDHFAWSMVSLPNAESRVYLRSLIAAHRAAVAPFQKEDVADV